MTAPVRPPQPPTRLGEWLRRNASWLFVVVLVFQTAVVTVMVTRTDSAIDDLKAATQVDLVATCERGNATREQINAVNAAQIIANEAGQATNRAVHATAVAIDGSAQALITAFESVGPLDPEARAAADAFLAANAELAATVEQELATAADLRVVSTEKLQAAVLALRDCDRILDDPNATVPPDATSTPSG